MLHCIQLFALWASKIRGVKAIEEIKVIIDQTMVAYVKEKVGEFKSVFLYSSTSLISNEFIFTGP